MKFIKIVLIVVVAVAAILAGIIFLGLKNLDSIVKSVIEEQGSQLTQTQVSLNDVNIHLTEGKGELQGLFLKNPAEYSDASAMQAGRIFLDIDPRSVTGDVVVIEQVAIEGLRILVEQKGLSTNLQTLLKAMPSASSDKEKPQRKETGSDVRMMIETVVFAEGNIALKTEKYGDYDLSLPDLKLNNIGDRQKGLSPAELGPALLQPIIQHANLTAKRRLEDLAKDKVKDKVKDKLEGKLQDKLGDKGTEKLKALKGLLEK